MSIEDRATVAARREALFSLATWHDVAQWIDYAALEFVADATTSGYLHHIGQCIRDEGERRYAAIADIESVSVA